MTATLRSRSPDASSSVSAYVVVIVSSPSASGASPSARAASTNRPSSNVSVITTSPPGAPVTTRRMRAVAPAHGPTLPNSSRASASHSAPRKPTPPTTRSVARARSGAPADLAADAREQVGLGRLDVHEAAGEDVVVERVDRDLLVARQAEPERGRGVDLRLVREQRVEAHVVEAGEVDRRRDAIVVGRPLEPVGRERRLEPELAEAAMQRAAAPPRPHPAAAVR